MRKKIDIPPKETLEGYRDKKWTSAQIAQHYEVSVTTIYQWFRVRGIERRRLARYVDLPNNELITLYNEGHSLSNLAARYDCSWGTIRNRLLQLGVNLCSKGNWRGADYEQTQMCACCEQPTLPDNWRKAQRSNRVFIPNIGFLCSRCCRAFRSAGFNPTDASSDLVAQAISARQCLMDVTDIREIRGMHIPRTGTQALPRWHS